MKLHTELQYVCVCLNVSAHLFNMSYANDHVSNSACDMKWLLTVVEVRVEFTSRNITVINYKPTLCGE